MWVGLLAWTLLIDGAHAEPPRPVGPRIRVALLGDSLTAGYGVTQSECFTSLLSTRLEANFGSEALVVNAGSSGATSASGLSRLKWHLKGSPTHLVLALGSNDALRGIPVTQTSQNLASILQLAQTRGLKTLLVGFQAPPNYGPDFAKAFAQIYPDLAKKFGLPLLPFLLDGVAGKPELNQSDGIHPNPQGHRIIAEHSWPFLQQLVSSKIAPTAAALKISP